MTISLHYLDKNWAKSGKGCADNIHLIVDFDNKVYKYVKNCCTPSFEPGHIEVKRKSDIDDYVKYLEKYGFIRTNKRIIRFI